MKHFKHWDVVQGDSGVDDSWLEHRRKDTGYNSINKICYFEQCCLLACLLSHNVTRIIIATAHESVAITRGQLLPLSFVVFNNKDYISHDPLTVVVFMHSILKLCFNE